jgi:hypothetical protein
MSVTTYTAQQVLQRVADELGDEAVKSAFVDNVNTTTIRAAGLSLGSGVNLQYALAVIEGKGVRSISTYYEADETIVVSGAFSPVAAVGDVISVYWWDAHKRAQAQRAINDAIRAVYPFWYRENVIDANNLTLADGTTAFTAQTFAAGTYEYALPSDLIKLSRVGVQTDASLEPVWYPPLDNWRQIGAEGAYKIRFKTPFVNENVGNTICYHYEAREPVFSTFTENDTTQLPLDYFSVAAEIYRRRNLSADNVVSAQWLAQEADKAMKRLGLVKKPLPRGPKVGFW